MPSKKKIVPTSAANVVEREKTPIARSIDYANSYPCWRFGNFDKDGPWGLNALLGFTFHYNENIYNAVSQSGIQMLDDELQELNGKEINDRQSFWDKLKNRCQCPIPIDVVEKIEDEMINNAFMEKIYPKLLDFEKITWEEIRLQTHSNKGKSNNHEIDITDLCSEAQRRLKILKFDDRDKIYSLRLGGTERIFGFKELNYLDIIWVDLTHEVCPTKKK